MGDIQKKNSILVDWDGLEKGVKSCPSGNEHTSSGKNVWSSYICINRRLKAVTDLKKKVQTVFPAQENELKSGIIKLSKRGFGLTPKDVRPAV